MNRRFADLEAMVAALRAAGVSEVCMTCQVATATPAGGEQLVFRGRLRVSADVAGESLQYEQELARRRVKVDMDDVPATAAQASDFQRAQAELARQIRLYRESYQSLVAEARREVAAALARAGITVAE